MADNTNLAIKLMYFGHNYPHNFISKVWNEDTHIAKHLDEKFSNLYHTHGTKTFFKWFMELSRNNQKKLVTWVNLNYSHKN